MNPTEIPGFEGFEPLDVLVQGRHVLPHQLTLVLRKRIVGLGGHSQHCR